VSLAARSHNPDNLPSPSSLAAFYLFFFRFGGASLFFIPKSVARAVSALLLTIRTIQHYWYNYVARRSMERKRSRGMVLEFRLFIFRSLIKLYLYSYSRKLHASHNIALKKMLKHICLPGEQLY